MKINIVTINSGWILQKIAERTASNNLDKSVEIVLSHKEDYSADVNYYVDLQNCYSGQQTQCDIAYFTHADMDSREWLIQLLNERRANNLKGIISMNKRYTDMLENVGFPKEKLITLTPGETYNRFPLKKIKIGVVSRGGYEGYGQTFVEQLLYSFDFRNYELYFLGNGWKNIQEIAQKRNISLNIISDENYSNYPYFYQSIDYLLIPGMWTAGPMSMQEALSTGIPIIAADVGFVNYEFKADYTFDVGDVTRLVTILKDIQYPIIQRRAQVENMRWTTYTASVIEFIKKIKQNG